MSKKLKITSKFIPLRYEWLPLIGYPLPVINKDGNVSIKHGSPQTKPFDYVDLLLISEISGYRELSDEDNPRDCFASPATLANAVGMSAEDSDKDVVKRLARYAAVGIIWTFYKPVMGQRLPQIVYRVNFQRIAELASEMEEQRKSGKVEPSNSAKIRRASTINDELLNYLKNYISDYLPDFYETTNETINNMIYEMNNQTTDLTTELHSPPEQLPQDRAEQVGSVAKGTSCQADTLPEAFSRSTGKEDDSVPEGAETKVSVSSTTKTEDLPPWVEGGCATVRDIFEYCVNPLKARGWTYSDIDDVVEKVTGQRQRIKDISDPEDRQAIYFELMTYVETGEKPEKKAGSFRSSYGGGERVTTAELLELANRFVDENSRGAWSREQMWDNISSLVAEITGEEMLIKDIHDPAHRHELREHLLYLLAQ